MTGEALAQPFPAAPEPFVRVELDHRPAPQGSYRPVPLKDAAGAYTGKSYMKASSAGLKEYRASLAWAVRAATRGRTLEEPVGVVLRFAFPQPARPKASSRCPSTGRWWPATRRTGDADKLTRAALDALTIGLAIADDSLVVATDVLSAYEQHDDPRWEGSTLLEVRTIAHHLMRRV